ncbi:MAG: endonuclease MutS2 [Dehalococcoidia bacterium]
MRTLEYENVRQRLATFTSFSLSEELALGLEPAYTVAEVTRLRDEAAEAGRLLELRQQLPLSNARDVRRIAQAAALGGQLTGVDLVDIANTMAVVHSIAASLMRLADTLPVLGGVAAGLGQFREAETAIRRAVNPRGEMVDAASELLGRLRSEERAAHDKLMDRLKEIVASPEGRRVLQEPFITTRDDRYVLAIKSEHRGQVQGLIHDVSSSGATVFMEPLATVELGNAWRELKLAQQREVKRVLLELSGQVGEQADALQESVERLARIDLAIAKARLGQALDGVSAGIIDPRGAGAPATVILREARHPLLTGKPVPISVEIGSDFQALVISGPNTGGKTVVLKTIGLLALMAQAGIPVPAAEGSALQVFDGVYADIGDEQSIQQSLSTFSAHMSNIVGIMRVATGQSLVLLDELGAGTDPQEGAAVAKAILSALARAGTTSVVTTHHSELKAFAHSAPGVENASVEFDPETLAPTYRLNVGLPGRSNALAIAQRLGLPEPILDEARASLGSGLAEVEALLGEIQDQRRKVETELHSAEAARRELDQAQAQLGQQLEALEADRRRSVALERVEVQVMAEELKGRLRHARRRLNALVGKRGQQELAEIVAEVDSVRREMEQGAWRTQPAPEEAPGEPLRVGDVIIVEGVESPVEVIAEPDERGLLQVQAGQVRMQVHRDRVKGKASRRPDHRARVTVTRSAKARAYVGPEFWIHGMRARQAVAAVDEYIEKAALEGHQQVRIIHGKGRGVLRTAIQKALDDHQLVGFFRDAEPEEGGEGVTIVEL